MVFALALPAAAGAQAPVDPAAEAMPPSEARLLRYPSIHRDFVVFVYAGDVWRAPVPGGRAYRLTRVVASGPDRAMARAAFASIPVIATSLFYNNSMVLVPSQQVLALMVLGFVAWLDRRYPSGTRRGRKPRPPGAGNGIGAPPPGQANSLLSRSPPSALRVSNKAS